MNGVFGLLDRDFLCGYRNVVVRAEDGCNISLIKAGEIQKKFEENLYIGRGIRRRLSSLYKVEATDLLAFYPTFNPKESNEADKLNPRHYPIHYFLSPNKSFSIIPLQIG